MASVNKVILVGRIGKDPEVRHTPNGEAVAQASLATSNRRKDKNTGEYVEQTEWHQLKFFKRLAEIVGDHVKKGDQIYVEGRIVYGKYTDKNGVEKYTTDIIVNELQMLGGRSEQSADAPRPAQKPADKPVGGSGFEDLPDDLPY